ncbi:hypothetical protein [Kribbella sp. NPDC051620]|uniref:hypothetical protein n=1 Tax=Kribbella sp. NPDC051620 TaxID=3364120 RepID=UPI0037B7B751
MTTPPTSAEAQGNDPAEPDDFEIAHTAITRAIRAINNEQRAGDGAEFITHVLATVAANLGGTSAVVGARSGSWEASGVTDLLHSTVGADDDYLLTYRTEPIEIVASSLYELDDLRMYETYEASVSHIGRVLFGDRWTPGRGRLTVAELDQLEDVHGHLAELEQADRSDYESRFAAVVQARWEDLRAGEPWRYPERLQVTVRFVPDSAEDRALTEGWGDDVASRLYQYARENTLLPGSDAKPDWSPGFVDRLLVDGHWPHLRVPELARFGTPDTGNDPRS